MTDIPSGADDSELSDMDADLMNRPNSAPPTLFGMNLKKALSRPADRVEQAERKAERMERESACKFKSSTVALCFYSLPSTLYPLSTLHPSQPKPEYEFPAH